MDIKLNSIECCNLSYIFDGSVSLQNLFVDRVEQVSNIIGLHDKMIWTYVMVKNDYFFAMPKKTDHKLSNEAYGLTVSLLALTLIMNDCCSLSIDDEIFIFQSMSNLAFAIELHDEVDDIKKIFEDFKKSHLNNIY